MAKQDLPRILEDWRRHGDINLESKNGGTPEAYFELSWRKPGDVVTRYIDVYPQSDTSAVVQHGTYGFEGSEERQRGTICRTTYDQLPEVLSRLRDIAEAMSPRPWRYHATQELGSVKSLKFR